MRARTNTASYRRYAALLKDVMDKEIPAAVKVYLDSIAYHMRTIALSTVHKTMTVRSANFVRAHLRYQKARKSRSIARMFSRVGSTDSRRFSGWTAQEDGTKPDKNRVATPAGRVSRSFKRVMRKAARLNPGSNIPVLDDLGNVTVGAAENTPQMIAIAMRKLRKKGYTKGLVRLRRGDARSAGFYLIYSKRLVKVQSFARRRPKRLKWMRKALEQFARTHRADRLWTDAAKRVIKNRGRV